MGISLGQSSPLELRTIKFIFKVSLELGAHQAHQIPFAELMVAVDLLLWMFMIHAWDRGHKVLSAFLLLASLAALYESLLSVTRGAWLAYVVMIVVWVVYTIGKSLKNIKYFFTTRVLLRLLFAGLVFWGVSQTDQYKTIEARSSKTFNDIADGGLESVARLALLSTSIP